MRIAWALAPVVFCQLLCAEGVIAIYPSPVSVTKGTTQQFTTYVTVSPNTIVWSVNGVVGGDGTNGTITSGGLYTAPSVIPASNVVTVRATSTAKPAIYGDSAVTIAQPTPWVWSTYPNSFTTGTARSFSVNGAGLIPQSVVRVNGVPWTTTYVNATTLTATGDLPNTGTFAVTVAQPDPGGLISQPYNIKVTAAPVVPVKVTLSPTSGKVVLGGTAQFTATVANASNTAVTWTATAGTISSTGLYTAPATMPASSTVTIVATSVADPTKTAQAAVTLQPPAAISVTVSPASTTTVLGATAQFTATVANTANTAVTWTATVGTISSGGLYTAPTTMPASSAVTIVATSVADSTKSAQAKVTLQLPAPISITVSPTSATVALSNTAQFTATVSNSSNTAVTWTATAGTISSGGLYTAPVTMPVSSAVTIVATSVADTTKSAQATVVLQAFSGNNGANLTAGRFLEQATFGPTPLEIANVQSKGTSGWLDAQFAMSETAIVMPTASQDVKSLILNRLATAPDQLRQKMAWALGQIIVISMNKNIYADEYVPYLQILSRNAFGNYRKLLGDIAVSPQMGKYLDLANSNKPGVGGGANENFARELMQLFTIGLYQLNPDGSPNLSAPTYSQADVRQIALALTGWTYPTAAGATPATNNWEDFSAPVMETRPANHDTSQKTFLNGCVLPAGQTVQQDLDGVLDCVFNHPNAGPFVATRLIRSLVTSNPSPQYIQRIATVFNNNGQGVRGDLSAVLRAILTDPEARLDTATPTSGRLKDPIYFIVSFVRAMGGTIVPGTVIPWNFVAMGQEVANPPSVFSYYSPLYRLPINAAMFGPEFQIYTPTEAVERANLLYQIIHQPNGDPSISLSALTAVAGNTAQLLDLVDQVLFYGRMPAGIRTSIGNAINAQSDNTSRLETALYLGALSGQYAVQY